MKRYVKLCVGRMGHCVTWGTPSIQGVPLICTPCQCIVMDSVIRWFLTTTSTWKYILSHNICIRLRRGFIPSWQRLIGRHRLDVSVGSMSNRRPEGFCYIWDISFCWWEGLIRPRVIQNSALILCLRPANERRRYFVTTSLIGWVQD